MKVRIVFVTLNFAVILGCASTGKSVLDDGTSVPTRTIVDVVSNAGAVAGLKSDGSVLTWGDALCGGDSDSVADALTEGVSAISPMHCAFVAFKSDGTHIVWGEDQGKVINGANFDRVPSSPDFSGCYLGRRSARIDTLSRTQALLDKAEQIHRGLIEASGQIGPNVVEVRGLVPY